MVINTKVVCMPQKKLIQLKGLTHEVCQHRESSDAESTKGGCCWDVSIQLMHHTSFTVTPHHHLVIFELLSNLQGDKESIPERVL